MKPPSFLFVANRGHMKAYQFKRAIGRNPSPNLVDEIDLAEAHAKYDERFTDQAGSFPSRTAPGIASSVAERLPLEEETKNRSYRRLAGQLEKWLDHYKPKTWGFAATSEMNNAILRELGPLHQKNLICNLKQDLVLTPSSELLGHLEHEFTETALSVHGEKVS